MFYFVHHFLVHYKYQDKDPTLCKKHSTATLKQWYDNSTHTLVQNISSQSRPSSGNPSLSESSPQTRPSPT